MSGEEPGRSAGQEEAPPDLREIPARRGFSLVYRGKTLLSRVDPVGQAECLAAEVPLRERTLYFCPSPLYGYGLSLLLERLKRGLKQKNSALLCAEADEKLFEISRNALGAMIAAGDNSAGGFPLLALVNADTPPRLCAFVRKTWGTRVFRGVEIVKLPGGRQLFPELYDDMARALGRELALEWGNAMTLIRLGRLYTKNLIRNLALLPESESGPDFGSAPVLVLGAGPSLDSVLDEISALSGGRIPAPGERSYKIVCVDTCLPALHDRGIFPDLVVILESQHWNLRDFSGAAGRTIDAVFDLSALPSSARVLGGKRFFFATAWTALRLWERLEKAGLLPQTFPPLGSVGLSAAALALRAGSGPVFMGGIDFSFTPDAYHARSTPGHSERERRQNRFRTLVNAGAVFREGSFSALSKTGAAVRSEPSMRNYRDLFEREFGGNPRLFDTAGSGLPLGVQTVSAARAFAVLNCEGTEKNAPPQKAPANNTKETLAAFIQAETRTLTELKETLAGEKAAVPARLEELLDIVDYLWAHFPDCAGAGGRRPPCTDLSFLKRVRTEIDPFLKYWEAARRALY